MSSDLQRTLAELGPYLALAHSAVGHQAGDAGAQVNAESAFKQRLYAAGVIGKLPPSSEPAPATDRVFPIDIEGPPLSQTIVEERR